MAYNEKLVDRIREVLSTKKKVSEKAMFGGICFMVNDKMLIGVSGEDMMCRIGPEAYEAALERRGCREMDFTGRPMVGYVFVDESSFSKKSELEYWINLCLEFNPKAKSSKKSIKKAKTAKKKKS